MHARCEAGDRARRARDGKWRLKTRGAIASVGSVGPSMAPVDANRDPHSMARRASKGLDCPRLPSMQKNVKGHDCCLMSRTRRAPARARRVRPIATRPSAQRTGAATSW